MFDFIPGEIWDSFWLAMRYIVVYSPLWLPLVFLYSSFNAWLNYKRAVFWSKQKPVLLEIKLPREILKSPAAMEVVMGAFFQTGGEGTWIDRIWKGQTRPWFSLEIISQSGRVRFFIWMWSKFKNLIESQIYAQYPGVEVYEVEDYTIPEYYHPQKKEVWACHYALTQPDPYPIKTYIDYGLDKDPKEEYKVDPMTALIEFFGSITQGQNVWMQIIIRAHKKRRFMDVFSEKEDQWKEEQKKEVNIILEKLKTAKEGGFPRIPTKGEAEIISALERSISKLPFDCTIRSVYITEKDKFNPSNIGGITGALKQYGSLNLNGFKPAGWMTIFDYPWQEWFGAKEKLKPKVLDEYKLRRFFYSPFKGKKFYSKPFVLNTEELATIFHFPGTVAATPTLDRVPSKKSEAPANLPT